MTASRAAVDRAVARGLAADPTQRHPSMNALLGALTGARDPRPLKPLLIAGAIGVVLAATTTAAIVTRHQRAAVDRRDRRRRRR